MDKVVSNSYHIIFSLQVQSIDSELVGDNNLADEVNLEKLFM